MTELMQSILKMQVSDVWLDLCSGQRRRVQEEEERLILTFLVVMCKKELNGCN